MATLRGWRSGGPGVGALASGSSDLSASPAWGHLLCSWASHFTSTLPLSNQVYKWVLANLMLGEGGVLQ